MPKYEGSFKQKYEQNGINYNNARAYKKKHKGIDDNILLEQYINMLNSEKITIADICKRANVDEGLYRRIKFNNKGLSSEEIIQKCKEHTNKKTFIDRCREAGINERAATLYKSRHKLSDDETINKYMNKKKSFSEKCRNAGVDYQKAFRIKTKEKINDEEAIKRALEVKKDFKEKCKEAGVSYGAARAYRRRYKLTDEDAILKCKNKPETFKDICKLNNVNVSSAVTYMTRTRCSLEECIIHFRTDLCLNIFGEIIKID